MALDPSAWSGLRLDALVDEGNRNEVWQGTIGTDRVAVRASRRSVESLEWELDLISHLAGLAFWVPEVVPADDGSRHVDGVVVQRWLKGEPPVSRADWQLVASELQRLHHDTTNYPQRPGCCRTSELHTRRRSVDAELDQMPTAIQRVVTDVFASVAHLPAAVIHGDVDASNMRIHAGRVGLLDWDESRVDVAWHDLSPLGVLPPADARRAVRLSHAWEAANGWVAEPDYARDRLTALEESLRPRLVYLHGWAGHGGEWDAVIERFGSSVDAIAPNLPHEGTGDELVAKVVELLEEAENRPTIVVGQSMGGVVATRAAAARPDLVDALVLLEAGMAALDASGLDGMRRWLDSWPRSFADRNEAAEFFGADEPSTPAWVAGLVECDGHLVPNFMPEQLLAQARSTLHSDRWREWAQLSIPTTVIRASRSTIDDADIDRMRMTRPDVTFVTVDDSGHDVHLDQPTAVAAIVARCVEAG